MAQLIDRACVRCGKLFQAPYKKGHYVRKTCSKQCSKRWFPPAIERFWMNTDKDGPLIIETRCWQWLGAVNDWNYPNFYENKKCIKGHRWAYIHFKGPVPEGKILRHRCDNSRCVNPEHLIPGTLSDNSQDMLTRGRSGNTRLSLAEVRAIAEKVKGQPVSFEVYKPIARAYGVSESTVYGIHVGRTWSAVTGFPRMKLTGKTDFCARQDFQSTNGNSGKKPTESR